jgi:homoserine O-acetyltransferase
MVAARSVAMLSYRNYQTYQATQIDDDANKTDRFKAASYQQYQGDKLARRFNAFSYYSLSKTMDSHNIGRGRESIVSALQTIEAHTLVLGIRSDYLFPVSEQKFLARHIPEAVYAEIDSHYGHDGFLVETEKLTICVREFLRKQERINRMCANLQPNNA